MNQEQLEKAIAVVKGDATLGRHYINVSGDMCVIGGLAAAAGFSKDKLYMLGAADINRCGLRVTEVRQAISEAYGLTKLQMIQLQDTNDGYCDDEIERRREALIDQLKTFVK
jgi:hypothetical protein